MQKQRLRLALISTPRSGNNWVRHLLTNLYGIPIPGVHRPEELDWGALPDDIAFGIHWRRSPIFERQLREHGFRVVVLARHPLDVLISILQFCWRSPTGDWLLGEGGNERPLYGAMPRSAAFFDYAKGPRAAALFSVSREWWGARDVLPVRYEDLVSAPEATLGRLVEALGVPPRVSLEEALRGASIPALRERTRCAHHFWQGTPGLWKSLLTTAEAEPIAEAHAALFAELGYACDPAVELEPARADANWLDLVGDALAADLRALPGARREADTARQEADAARCARDEQAAACVQVRAETEAARLAYEDMRSRYAAVTENVRWLEDRVATIHEELGKARLRLQLTEQAGADLREELLHARARLAPFADVGPGCLQAARVLKRLAAALPWTAGLARRILHRPAAPAVEAATSLDFTGYRTSDPADAARRDEEVTAVSAPRPADAPIWEDAHDAECARESLLR